MLKDNLKLVISKPHGFKGGLLLSKHATLVDPATGEAIHGVRCITLNFQAKECIRCTAEIQISDIEIVEGDIAVENDDALVAGRETIDIIVPEKTVTFSTEGSPQSMPVSNFTKE